MNPFIGGCGSIISNDQFSLLLLNIFDKMVVQVMISNNLHRTKIPKTSLSSQINMNEKINISLKKKPIHCVMKFKHNHKSRSISPDPFTYPSRKSKSIFYAHTLCSFIDGSWMLRNIWWIFRIFRDFCAVVPTKSKKLKWNPTKIVAIHQSIVKISIYTD